MKYIKTYEELDHGTYTNASGKLKDLGFGKRADRMGAHQKKHQHIVSMYKAGHQDLEPFEVVMNKLTKQKTGNTSSLGDTIFLKLMKFEVHPYWEEIGYWENDESPEEDYEEVNLGYRVVANFYKMDEGNSSNNIKIDDWKSDKYKGFLNRFSDQLFPHIVILNPKLKKYHHGNPNVYFGTLIGDGDVESNGQIDGSDNYVKFSNRKDAVRFKKLISTKKGLFHSDLRDKIQEAIGYCVQDGWYKKDELTVDSIIDIILKDYNINLMYDEDYVDIHKASKSMKHRESDLRDRMVMMDFKTSDYTNRIKKLAQFVVDYYIYNNDNKFKKILYDNINILQNVLDNLNGKGSFRSKDWNADHHTVIRAKEIIQELLDEKDEYNEIPIPDKSKEN